MLFSKTTALLSLALGAIAQRPADQSICDYYTTALLKDNNATNQYTLLTLVVNTVVIGNYTQPNVGIAVPGILAKGTYNGADVNLLPYFNGALASSNRGGNSGVSVNFLDDGGAEPLKKNMPANGQSSNQYKLLTHLYQFFGSLLGCSDYGMTGFPAYAGFGSMASVHRFMDLDANQVGYFIEQVGLAASSFGVTKDDATAVGESLNKLFGYKCSPPTTVIKAQGAQLQSICENDSCPADPNATCAAYPAESTPALVSSMASSSSMPMSTGMANGTVATMSPTGTMPAQQSGNAGTKAFASMGFVGAAIAIAAAL